jgi:hypothetical protein
MGDGVVLAGLMAQIAGEAEGEAPELAALASDCASIGNWMLRDASLDDRLAGSVPFCTMCAVTVAGWQLLRQARAVVAGDAPALATTKPAVARYFLTRIIPEAAGLKASAMAGAELLYALDAGQLAG